MIKGELARKAHPGRCVSPIVLDVVGDNLGIIAPGSTATDSSTFADAVRVLKKYSLLHDVLHSVRTHLLENVGDEEGETLKEGEFSEMNVDNVIIFSNATATEAAGGKRIWDSIL